MGRRVYMLPDELLSDIERFQKRRGLPSEVAAVRELLNDALQGRESGKELEDRVRTLARPEALKLLAMHPRVHTLEFGPTMTRIECVDGHEFALPPHPRGQHV